MEIEDRETETSKEDSPAVLPGVTYPEACVICLDRITDKAIALPCRHDNFDFACLCTWLETSRLCPLCKAEVKWIKYELSNSTSGTVWTCPVTETPQPRILQAGRGRRPFDSRSQSSYQRGGRQCSRPSQPYVRGQVAFNSIGRPDGEERDSTLALRQHVYRNQLYSLHVGANRISRHRNITAATLAQDPHQISRAKTWIRRELLVFSFLNPSSADYGTIEHRASNAEFLQEYIIAILKVIDIRGSGGQAEVLLSEFLGRENTRLFLHELEAWLRSPYEKLEDWDRTVQYAEHGTSVREANVRQRDDRRMLMPEDVVNTDTS